MSSTATITGKVGPGLTMTAGVITNVTALHLDCPNEVLSVTHDNVITDIDVSAGTTWTLTVSGNSYTLSVT